VLGRRKTPVELLLYDISNGVSKKFSGLLLGKRFEAIYHSAVLVFGSEYWYGGDVFRTEPPNTEIFGPPLEQSVTHLMPSIYRPELQVVHLGYTLMTLDEFHSFLYQEMMPKYTRDNYDVMEHNCNCFSNDVVQFLTGKSIPDPVRLLPQLVMKTPTARILRPFLNRWLGGFGGGAAGKHSLSQEVEGHQITTLNALDVQRDVLGGDLIEVKLTGQFDSDAGEVVVATVLKQDGDNVDIKYFSPTEGKFNETQIQACNIIRDLSQEKRDSIRDGQSIDQKVHIKEVLAKDLMLSKDSVREITRGLKDPEESPKTETQKEQVRDLFGSDGAHPLASSEDLDVTKMVPRSGDVGNGSSRHEGGLGLDAASR
jgi:hypothetical protein